MKIWIVRHGEAGPYQAQDELRELTARGQQDISALATRLQALGCSPEKILVSPYLRTQQTFAILQKHCLWPLQADLSEALVPEANPHAVLRQLDEKNGEVLLVSHQPLVSSMIALFVDGNVRSAMQYPMHPGSLALLDCLAPMPAAATLVQLLAPPYV